MLRELSTKRIGFDKAAFVKTSADLLPVLCQAWDAQWAVIEGLLPAVAAGKIPNGGSEAGLSAAEAMSLGTVCVKARVFGIYSPNQHCSLLLHAFILYRDVNEGKLRRTWTEENQGSQSCVAFLVYDPG